MDPKQFPDTAGQWGVQALWEQVSPLLPGLSIEVVERIGSTNVELADRLRMASHSARGRDSRADDLRPALLVAVQQTQGRGRLGRGWQAQPQASLTFSLSVPIARADWSGLSLAVGLALARALDPAGQAIGLKWPNDLWRRDGSQRKLGGVLIEALPVGEQRVAVIGIGLNVQPLPLAERFAALSEFLPQPTPASTLAAVMPSLAQALVAFEQQGFAGVAADYAAHDLLRGERITTTDPACPEGVAEGVDRDGALLVRSDAGLQRIVSGEVSVRPVAQPLP
jgi:BirA family transcriptional regulator, biotin operon repressor / biotin---[acetyl-CoA-carboxylase] ligase